MGYLLLLLVTLCKHRLASPYFLSFSPGSPLGSQHTIWLNLSKLQQTNPFQKLQTCRGDYQRLLFSPSFLKMWVINMNTSDVYRVTELNKNFLKLLPFDTFGSLNKNAYGPCSLTSGYCTQPEGSTFTPLIYLHKGRQYIGRFRCSCMKLVIGLVCSMSSVP